MRQKIGGQEKCQYFSGLGFPIISDKADDEIMSPLQVCTKCFSEGIPNKGATYQRFALQTAACSTRSVQRDRVRADQVEAPSFRLGTTLGHLRLRRPWADTARVILTMFDLLYALSCVQLLLSLSPTPLLHSLLPSVAPLPPSQKSTLSVMRVATRVFCLGKRRAHNQLNQTITFTSGPCQQEFAPTSKL